MAKKKQDKDPIKALLAGLQPTMFLGNPSGTVAITEEKVIEAGGDPDAVLEWVIARGGHRDKSFGVSQRGGFNMRPKPPTRHYYVLPQEALE